MSKPFIVIDDGLRLKIERCTSGWYMAQSLDDSALMTQGETVEDVIANAHDAAKALDESRALMASQLSTPKADTAPAKETKKQARKNSPRKLKTAKV